MSETFDSKAVRILFDTYWSSKGWKSERFTSPEDLAYAKSNGVMFEPLTKSHDAILSELTNLVQEIDPKHVGDAFLYSLSTRQLAYRSALGSYAMSRWLPHHRFSGEMACSICGEFRGLNREDISVLNFERIKWGGVRHQRPYFAFFDLSEFVKLPTQQPTTDDMSALAGILRVAAGLSAETRPRDLEKAIASLFKSSKNERNALIQILGYCGILQPKNHSGFFREYTTYSEREERPVNKIDWNYPVSWWQGKDAVNFEAVRFYFPDLPHLNSPEP